MQFINLGSTGELQTVKMKVRTPAIAGHERRLGRMPGVLRHCNEY